MALTKEDLQAIQSLLEPITNRLDSVDKRLDTMQEDITGLKTDVDQIKEDTAITRDVVNGVSEWTEVASDVLKISYPLQKAE